MNQVFKQHTQNVENHYKFLRCARAVKLAKLNSKKPKYSPHKIRQNADAKRTIKKNNDELNVQTT